MKLSFSRNSKPALRATIRTSHFSDDAVKDDGKNTAPEFVTEFDPSRSSADSVKKYIIPPKQNEWRPVKKMKNLELPIGLAPDSTLSFEVEAPAGDAADSGMSYGLNVRKNSVGNGGSIGNNVKSSPDGSDVGDTYWSQPSASVDGLLLEKLKEDLNRLPEDPGFEEFDDVPVEGFGAALLAGYGWSEGQGIGKNAKEDVKVRQISKRTAKEGLGFKADDLPPGQKSTVQNGHNAASGDVFQHKWISVGKYVRIVGGRNAGSKAKIIDILHAYSEAPLISLKLLKGDERLTLHIHEIAEIGSVEEEKCMKKLKGLHIDDQRVKDEQLHSTRDRRHGERRDSRADDYRKDNKRDRNEDRRGHQVKHSNGAAQQTRNQTSEKKAVRASWLVRHIRVRVISKDFRGGKFYLRKGKVEDVVEPTVCDIIMDDSEELIQGVNQKLLETALPRRGGRVIVLYGKHKGVLGSLVDKNKDGETGVIQDSDSHDFLTVALDQIAEYVGDSSFLDY